MTPQSQPSRDVTYQVLRSRSNIVRAKTRDRVAEAVWRRLVPVFHSVAVVYDVIEDLIWYSR